MFNWFKLVYLKSKLDNKNEDKARSAINKLAEVGSNRSIEILCQFYENNRYEYNKRWLCNESIEAIQQIGKFSPDIKVRMKGILESGKSSISIAKYFERLLLDSNFNRIAAKILQQIGDESITPTVYRVFVRYPELHIADLLDSLKWKPTTLVENIYYHAVKNEFGPALAFIKGKRNTADLVELTNYRYPTKIRIFAARILWGLENCPSDVMNKILLEFMCDKFSEFHEFACEILKEKGDLITPEHLLIFFKKSKESLGFNPVEITNLIKERADPIFTKDLLDSAKEISDTVNYKLILETLVKIANPIIVEPLLLIFKKSCDNLWTYGNPPSADLILKALEEIVRKTCTSIDSKILREIIVIQNLTMHVSGGTDQYDNKIWKDYTIDCSRLKNLAKEEIEKRNETSTLN
jgi:hypothetical protein